MAVRVLAGIVPVVVAVAVASAQAPQSADAEPSFEVASVKANRTGAPGGSFVMPPGRFTASNLPLRVLIANAYQLSFFQLVGGPDWAGTERFDIAAKAPDGAPPEQTRAMVRTLLRDRFRLVVHMESRDTPMYALVQAPGDRLGPRIARSSMDCGPIREQRAAANAAAVRARGPVPVPPAPASNEPVVCQMRVGGRGGPTLSYRARNITMVALAGALRPYVGREVVDRTGLTGEFDFDLEFAPPPASAAGPADGPVPPAPLDEAASIFTALQEQLGLKLESTRGPVEVMVIDRAERPTED